jgi:hypothetical protein
MKIQNILLKATVKMITWWSVVEILGVTDDARQRWQRFLRNHREGIAAMDFCRSRSPP